MVAKKQLLLIGLLVLSVAPLSTGCATLGIAKLEDLQATETRLANRNTSTNATIKSMKQDMQNLQDWNAKQQVSMDSLLSGIAEMRQWISALNVEAIAEDATFAKTAAAQGEKRWSDILERLVTNLRTQQAAKDEELLYLESLWNALQINMAGAGISIDNEAPKGANGSDDSGG